MGLLKKLGRGIKRVAKKNRGGIARLAKKVGPGLVMSAVLPTAAPLIVKAASAAKSLGKKARGLETPKSLVPVVRAAQVRVKKTRSKMPGGAPMPSMPTIGTPAIGMMSSRPQAKRTLYGGSPNKVKRVRKTKRNPEGVKVTLGRAPGIGKDQLDKSLYYTRGKNKGKKRRVMRAPPSAKQLAARAAFAARRKKKAA